MSSNKINRLIVIENGQLISYDLDNKLVWEVGRPSINNVPDIKLHTLTVSRKHGRFQNMDGMWFYIDKKGKNGTVYNGKYITTGLKGRIKPVALKNGDILIFGGGKEAIVNYKTIWAMFSEKDFSDRAGSTVCLRPRFWKRDMTTENFYLTRIEPLFCPLVNYKYKSKQN